METDLSKKHCPCCGQHKDKDCFCKDKHTSSGLSAYCRQCCSSKNKKIRERDPERTKRLQTRNTLKFLYGISPEEKANLFEKQNGKCAICETELKNISSSHLDHDHETNKIRGLLCHNCNRGIGYLKDSVDILNKSIIYLNKFR